MRPSVKAAGEKAAKASNRSLSSLLETLLIEHLKIGGYLPSSGKAAGKRKWVSKEAYMNANIWLIVVVVLVVLSVILAIMDRSFLSPMYLLVLALVVMVGTSVKFPW
jgi:preprotein translocase subunit SecE